MGKLAMPIVKNTRQIVLGREWELPGPTKYAFKKRNRLPTSEIPH